MFVHLEKDYDRVSRGKLLKVLRKYGVNGQLLRAIKSFYCRPEVCVWVNCKQLKPFHVGIGLWQGCNNFATSPFHCLNELSKKGKLSIFKIPFVPFLSFGLRA